MCPHVKYCDFLVHWSNLAVCSIALPYTMSDKYGCQWELNLSSLGEKSSILTTKPPCSFVICNFLIPYEK